MSPSFALLLLSSPQAARNSGKEITAHPRVLAIMLFLKFINTSANKIPLPYRSLLLNTEKARFVSEPFL
jgi:hypothetical protein